MSYTRQYSERIYGTEYVTVHHPASESSSSETISVDWSEDVDIEVFVDTSSFDDGVSTIKHHIDGLTGAVVATEAAQIEEKIRGTNAISQSVTTGFFGLIRSEITQQMAALKSRVDSLFLKMNDMEAACKRIQQNMEQDYHRITDRYTATFEELDRELEMRLAALDRASYAVKRDVATQSRRSFDSTLSTVPTVFGGETSHAQSLLAAGSMRSRMNDLLQCAIAYLVSEKRTSEAVSTMLVSGGREDAAVSSLPVAYLAASDTAATSMARIFLPPAPGFLGDDAETKRDILAQFRERSLPWKPLAGEDRAQIERFLIPLIDTIHTASQDRDARVRRMILNLWSAHTPQTLPL